MAPLALKLLKSPIIFANTGPRKPPRAGLHQLLLALPLKPEFSRKRPLRVTEAHSTFCRGLLSSLSTVRALGSPEKMPMASSSSPM